MYENWQNHFINIPFFYIETFQSTQNFIGAYDLMITELQEIHVGYARWPAVRRGFAGNRRDTKDLFLPDQDEFPESHGKAAAAYLPEQCKA